MQQDIVATLLSFIQNTPYNSPLDLDCQRICQKAAEGIVIKLHKAKTGQLNCSCPDPNCRTNNVKEEPATAVAFMTNDSTKEERMLIAFDFAGGVLDLPKTPHLCEFMRQLVGFAEDDDGKPIFPYADSAVYGYLYQEVANVVLAQ